MSSYDRDVTLTAVVVVLLSFNPANRYGKRGQSHFGGACGGRHTGPLPHLRDQCPPGAYVERAVHDRVHTRVSAREHEQRVLHLLVDHLRRLRVRPIPVRQTIYGNQQRELSVVGIGGRARPAEFSTQTNLTVSRASLQSPRMYLSAYILFAIKIIKRSQNVVRFFFSKLYIINSV